MEREYTNVMEEIVVTWVQILMSGNDYQTFCSCKKCKSDIITLSLNTLPNYYVTTEEGRVLVFEKLNTEENRRPLKRLTTWEKSQRKWATSLTLLRISVIKRTF